MNIHNDFVVVELKFIHEPTLKNKLIHKTTRF